jgi:hypothetical protein
VLGNGCCFAGAGARLDYDRFVVLESLVIQELGNESRIPDLFLPACGQIIDWIDFLCFGISIFTPLWFKTQTK